MERTILFKAKKLSDGKWVKGSLVKSPLGTQIVRWEDSIEYIDYVDPSTVCQFTGLKDDFGKPIYENDIVDFRGEGEVLFRDGAFYAKFTKYAECLLSTLTKSKFTLMVVCNKFDRKEGEV